MSIYVMKPCEPLYYLYLLTNFVNYMISYEESSIADSGGTIQ